MASAIIGIALAVIPMASAADAGSFIDVLRARAATLPVVEASAEVGAPKFTVVRLNSPPILTAGECYGAVRVTCPPGRPLGLAWLFSDTLNIDEYDLIPLSGGKLAEGAQRLIYPATAHSDPEEEKPGHPTSLLPRPWDIFQLHLWGVPARLLQPGGEYLIWFRFSDRRPTDLLVAATFLDPAAKLDLLDLPLIFALPLVEAP
jgi:hypothetical protein